MKRTFQITFLIMILFYSVAQGEELGPYIGYSKGKGANVEYHLTFNFGIEQWEEGKLSTFRYQQWLLQCAYPDPGTGQAQTWCSLNRTVIDKWSEAMGGTVISTHKHYSAEETLKLRRINWQRGELDFHIILTDGSTIEVMLRMKFKDNSIHLDSFKAIGIARGILTDTMVPLEYKIPRYTYTLNVPVEMIGLRSKKDKKWDDMIATLSKQDQESWKKFIAKSDKECRAFDKFDDQLKKIIPNYEKRQSDIEKGAGLTPEEKNKLGNYFAEEFGKCIANSGVSKDGQKKILDFMRQMAISEM